MVRKAHSGAPRDFLIAALSGRSLAAAAARAGHRAFVLDLFNDSDLAAMARKCGRVDFDGSGGFEDESLLEAARNLDCGEDVPLVYGAGFEDRPQLLQELAGGRTLCGNSPQTLARIKDPGDFFATLERLGIRYPETRLTPPGDSSNDLAGWLVKPVGGSGGRHIRPVDKNSPPDTPVYYQKILTGRAVSLLFLGDGKRIRALGLSEQFTAPFPPDHPFRFGFAVTRPDGDATLEAGLTRTAAALSEVYGLVGLNSLDALLDEAGELHILEVNPRPGATLDLFDSPAGANLFDLHVAAVVGDLPPESKIMGGRADVCRACAIFYADASFHMGEGMDWPQWTADRPRVGTAFTPGDPICTVFAEGDTPNGALDSLVERAGPLRDGLARCKGAGN